ncbi:MAG: multicopper oxidase domain-containing protein, partial [Chloroflexi bacterium]|nr:multicopper oxidase domain-containing protein [Chloroflexota bacterium]
MSRYHGSRSGKLLPLLVVLLLAFSFSPQPGAYLAQAAHQKFITPLPIPPVITDQDITITLQEAELQVLPGPKTRMWTFNGIFPGPTLRRPSGQTTRVTFINRLPPEAGCMTIHNHGNNSASSEDGQPDNFLICPEGVSPGPDLHGSHRIAEGVQKTYLYDGMEGGRPERAATQWYHDHRMDVTGRNVFMGLAGFYIWEDEIDPHSLPLPQGEFDVPLMIADRVFDAHNQLVYSFELDGVFGNHILVNGAVQPFFEVADRQYRFRILAASNARIFRFQLSNGQPFHVIGTDGGLMESPVTVRSLDMGPAERVEIVIDFKGKFGQEIVLINALGDRRENTRDILQFRVARHLEDESSVPPVLYPFERLDPRDAVVTREFKFSKHQGVWGINSHFFNPHVVLARVKLGSVERWVLENNSGEPHLIHIHLTDQQVISRNGKSPNPIEARGLKETHLLMADGERVEVLI